ncbi:hypothetical protein ACFLV5_02085 [Chloroflexota bacterium]
MKPIRLIFIVFPIFLLIGSSVLAATDSYTIERGTIASGGDIRNSEDFSTRDIIGQTTGGLSNSEDYLLYSGFYGPYQPEESKAVGGNVYMVNKVNILLPWIAIAMVALAGSYYLIRRRVRG